MSALRVIVPRDRPDSATGHHVSILTLDGSISPPWPPKLTIAHSVLTKPEWDDLVRLGEKAWTEFSVSYCDGLRPDPIDGAVLPNGIIQGSDEDIATWWTCTRCGKKGPYVGMTSSRVHRCLVACGGAQPNPACTFRKDT